MNSKNLIIEPIQAPAMYKSAAYQKTLAHEWIETLLDITAFEVDKRGARPTIISRIFFIVTSAMYESWAAYHPVAIGMSTKGAFRRPENEHTQENQEIAISYAAFRTLAAMFPFDKEDEIKWLKEQLSNKMAELGYDPNDNSTDITTPQGIGNLIAQAILDERVKNDGDNSNQVNNYDDTTGYQPVNSVDKINDPDKWQPIEFTFPDGSKKTPKYLTPHWGKVTPFGLRSSSQFRPDGPPTLKSKDPKQGKQLMQDVEQVIKVNAFMSLETKAIVEIMRDGPMSTSQSGQWFRTANDIAIRDKHTLEQDIKMYFSLGAVGLDAFIASWESKLYYNSSRPWTLVHHLYKGKEIFGWGGAGQGTIRLKGENWIPYSPINFITPPFPGYVSGHSTVSGASARVLEFLTGSDYYGYSTVWEVGSLTEPGFPSHPSYPAYMMQQVEGRPLPDFELSKHVPISFPTFSSVAEAAGISRIWGGFHIQSDNIDGLVLGRKIAIHNWQILIQLFNGKL